MVSFLYDDLLYVDASASLSQQLDQPEKTIGCHMLFVEPGGVWDLLYGF